jgi:putative ABC transport system permease protein
VPDRPTGHRRCHGGGQETDQVAIGLDVSWSWPSASSSAALSATAKRRWQVRAMLRWEAAIMAATGTTVGLTLGALLGWAATRAFDLSATDVPVGLLATCAGAAVVASMLAASLPARRGARVDVLQALATE